MSGLAAVEGVIHRYYQANGGPSKFGFPKTDVQILNDASKGKKSWVNFGYNEVSHFDKGVILSGDKGIEFFTLEEYYKGPEIVQLPDSVLRRLEDKDASRGKSATQTRTTRGDSTEDGNEFPAGTAK